MLPETTAKILFVDDEQNVLNAISRTVRGKFDFETALSVTGALELIEDRGPFAVVVTDLKMDNIGGMELADRIRSVSPDTVCVILTGHADIDTAVAAVNEGKIFRYLTKPCPPDVLTSTIKEAIRKYEANTGSKAFTYTTCIEDGRPGATERREGCLAVTGYSAPDFVNDPDLWMNIILPQNRHAAREQMNNILERKQGGAIEIRIRKRDGSIRWLRDTAIPHFTERGTIEKIDGLIEDITPQKGVEKALHRSEARYQKIVDNSPGMVFQLVLRSDGGIEVPYISERCKDFFDLEPDRIIADFNLVLKKIEPKDRAEFLDMLYESAAKLESFQWNGRMTGEKVKWLHCTVRPERTETGETLWDGMLIDITRIKLAEEEIRSLAKFPSENPNPVLRVRLDGTIIYANKAARPMLQLWGTELFKKIPEDILTRVLSVHTSGIHNCVEIKCKDRYYSIVFAPIEEFDYVNIYARDITDVKKAQLELIRANEILKEHDRLKSEFVSTVSHELRTPLCIFKNIISNAMAGVMGKLSKQLFNSLETADKSIDRLSRIISDFLDISKIDSGNMQLKFNPVPVQALIEEVIETVSPLAEAKDIELVPDMPGGGIVIQADRDRVIQVLTNLLGNAVKFIPVNSKIEVILSDAGDEVIIAVRDNGPGLSRDEMEKVFNPFIQIHRNTGPGEHGTGLGLTISKELVELHGGKIWIDSVTGQGCTFSFTLPKKQKEKAIVLKNSLSQTHGDQ